MKAGMEGVVEGDGGDDGGGDEEIEVWAIRDAG